MPLLTGHRVPRWLLLGPGFVLGVGMTAYFGVSTGQLAVETVTGSWDFGDGAYPLWFFWVALPAYLLWGLGLTAATLAYRWGTAATAGPDPTGRADVSADGFADGLADIGRSR